MESGSPTDIDAVPADASAWHAEYRYRQLFHLTHDQYLDEPLDAIRWMLRIQQLEHDVERRKSRET